MEQIDRPEVLSGYTYKIKTGYGNLYVTINEYEDKPFELFAVIGKSGESITAKAEALGRLISLLLKNKVHMKFIVNQLEGITGASPAWVKKGLVKSLPDGIAKCMLKYMKEKGECDEEIEEIVEEGTKDVISSNKCPECKGTNIIHESGCDRCLDCDWSKCG